MTNHKIKLRATMGILGFGTFQNHESPTLWPSFQNSVPWANSLDPVQPLLAWLCFEFRCLQCLPSIALLFPSCYRHDSVLEATFSSQCLCCSSKRRNEMHQGQSSNGHGQNENADGETLRLPIFLGHVTVPNLVQLSMSAPFWITLITLDLIKWCKT